jgi:uncharacterized damage-inducible protein DinB
MITPGYVQIMAAYNAEMNRRIYATAGLLTDAERHEDRGVFWGSLHGTLNHLLWGDRIWMSRFAGWPKPEQGIKQSAQLYDDFAELAAARVAADTEISAWADGLDQAWLDQDLVWFSAAAQREMRHPRALLVTHLFNHQTHHRGHAHALLTHFGHDPGDTDLPLVLTRGPRHERSDRDRRTRAADAPTGRGGVAHAEPAAGA